MAEHSSGAFRTSIGGQALIEGILMRGPEKQAIVVRDKDGQLVEKVEELKLIKDRYPILGIPLIRGTVNFLAAMVSGVKEFLPVDVFLPGCPPRPDALFDACLKLKDRVNDPTIVVRER